MMVVTTGSGTVGRRGAGTAALALVVSLTACGTATPAPPQEPDPEPDDEQAESELPDEMVVAAPGQADVEPVSWDMVEWYGSTSLRLQFRSQGPPCQVLDRVQVEETPARVTLTLFQGRDPSLAADDPRCEDAPLRTFGVEVPLSEWVECPRTYVDGADGSETGC
jgi:predicted small lipoprotein YifL